MEGDPGTSIKEKTLLGQIKNLRLLPYGHIHPTNKMGSSLY